MFQSHQLKYLRLNKCMFPLLNHKFLLQRILPQFLLNKFLSLDHKFPPNKCKSQLKDILLYNFRLKSKLLFKSHKHILFLFPTLYYTHLDNYKFLSLHHKFLSDNRRLHKLQKNNNFLRYMFQLKNIPHILLQHNFLMHHILPRQYIHLNNNFLNKFPSLNHKFQDYNNFLKEHMILLKEHKYILLLKSQKKKGSSFLKNHNILLNKFQVYKCLKVEPKSQLNYNILRYNLILNFLLNLAADIRRQLVEQLHFQKHLSILYLLLQYKFVHYLRRQLFQQENTLHLKVRQCCSFHNKYNLYIPFHNLVLRLVNKLECCKCNSEEFHKFFRQNLSNLLVLFLSRLLRHYQYKLFQL